METNKIKQKRKMSTKDKVLIIVSIVMIVVAALALTGVWLWNSSLFQDEQVGEHGLTESYATDSAIKHKTVNFLLVGTDKDSSRSATLADTIMVVNYDMEGKKANILQIPRDTYVDDTYPTGSTNKINAIYNQSIKKYGDKAGLNGLTACINDNFKLPIDHYVTISMGSFTEIVDALGGIEVDSPFSFKRNGYTFKKGKQKMTGDMAKTFVRERKLLPQGDISRQKSQRAFMSGLMDRLLSATPGELTKMVPTLFTKVKTDLKVGEMVDLAKNVQQLKKADIVFHSIPGKYGSYDGLSMFSMNKEKTAEMLNEYFRPYTDDVPAEELGIIQIFDSVTVEDDATDMDHTGASSKATSSKNESSVTSQQ